MRLTPALFSLWVVALAAPVEDGSVTKSHTLSQRWENHGSLPADTKIPVRIALKQRNLHKGMDYLMEV